MYGRGEEEVGCGGIRTQRGRGGEARLIDVRIRV